jgi:porin
MPKAAFLLVLALVSAAFCAAQSKLPAVPAKSASAASEPAAHDFDSLNLQGSDIPMPGFRETVTGDQAGYRKAMLKYGLALRDNSLPSYSINLLNAPVAADQQYYVGQRPFAKWMTNPMLTWDMKQLHLSSAQLHVGLGFEQESWNKAGPTSVDVSTLYFYKSFVRDRVELKTGYLANNLEFVGLQAGGSLVTGAQGVYAVLPYEAGLTFFPEVTPSFNLKWNAPAHLYIKSSLERAPDAAGAQKTIDRNLSGLRFIPQGEKLVTIVEGGYRRAATESARWTWLRGGYIHNSTPYANSVTGTWTSGNYCAFLLGDQQLTRAFGEIAANGIYAGASAMIVPASMNTYTQYYEVRAYDEGPFHSRPRDTISVVATHSVYSRDVVKSLVAQGKSFWRNSSSITGSYTVRAYRGTYISMGLSYITGPAVTPKVANALVATVAPTIFF